MPIGAINTVIISLGPTIYVSGFIAVSTMPNVSFAKVSAFNTPTVSYSPGFIAPGFGSLIAPVICEYRSTLNSM